MTKICVELSNYAQNNYNYKQNSHFVGNQIILHWKQLNYFDYKQRKLPKTTKYININPKKLADLLNFIITKSLQLTTYV